MHTNAHVGAFLETSLRGDKEAPAAAASENSVNARKVAIVRGEKSLFTANAVMGARCFFALIKYALKFTTGRMYRFGRLGSYTLY